MGVSLALGYEGMLQCLFRPPCWTLSPGNGKAQSTIVLLYSLIVAKIGLRKRFRALMCSKTSHHHLLSCNHKDQPHCSSPSNPLPSYYSSIAPTVTLASRPKHSPFQHMDLQRLYITPNLPFHSPPPPSSMSSEIRFTSLPTNQQHQLLANQLIQSPPSVQPAASKQEPTAPSPRPQPPQRVPPTDV